MKNLFTLILLLSSLTASAQSRASLSITDRLELSRSPLIAQQVKTPDVAARHLRRAGRCLAVGLIIGLGSVALGAAIRNSEYPRVLPNSGIVIYNEESDLVPFFGALAGLTLTTAGGVHLIKAGNALER